jgi:hypothetical protein
MWGVHHVKPSAQTPHTVTGATLNERVVTAPTDTDYWAPLNSASLVHTSSQHNNMTQPQGTGGVEHPPHQEQLPPGSSELPILSVAHNIPPVSTIFMSLGDRRPMQLANLTLFLFEFVIVWDHQPKGRYADILRLNSIQRQNTKSRACLTGQIQPLALRSSSSGQRI